MLGSRVLQSGRTGGASKVAQHPRWNSLADCTTSEQHLQCYTELHVQTIRYEVTTSYMCRERPVYCQAQPKRVHPTLGFPVAWVVGLFTDVYGLGGLCVAQSTYAYSARPVIVLHAGVRE